MLCYPLPLTGIQLLPANQKDDFCSPTDIAFHTSLNSLLNTINMDSGTSA